jgi:hypothetical protein
MTPSDQDVTLIAHAVQLAVAPVFLLTGVGALLAVMTNRLARVIDRARVIEGTWSKLDEEQRAAARAELRTLAHRGRLAGWAINFCAFAALLVCGVVATLFLDVFLATSLKWLVGALFIVAMMMLICGLTSFLREVYLATHTLRIGPPRSEGG